VVTTWSIALVLCLAGCVDPSLGGDAPLDVAVADKAPGPDLTAPDTLPPDMAIPDLGISATSALQVVMDRIILPESGSDYCTDLDGNGTKENQLGMIMGALKLAGGAIDPQKELDTVMKQGQFLLLLDLKAHSIIQDSAVQVRCYLGQDLDSYPGDNFSGFEELGIDPASPSSLAMTGKVAMSQLVAGPGTIIIPVPISGSTSYLNLVKARMWADLSATHMKKGIVSGAVPMSEVDKKLLPVLANLLDLAWKGGASSQLAQLLAMLDTDKDKTIEASDLKNNALVGAFFAADVDTDGDKKMDSMSMGLGFTAVKCKIKGT